MVLMPKPIIFFRTEGLDWPIALIQQANAFFFDGNTALFIQRPYRFFIDFFTDFKHFGDPLGDSSGGAEMFSKEECLVMVDV